MNDNESYRASTSANTKPNMWEEIMNYIGRREIYAEPHDNAWGMEREERKVKEWNYSDMA